METAVSTPTATIQPISTMRPTATATAVPTPTPACAPRTDLPRRFLALGDSYTIGESVPETDRWSVQLVANLREQGVNIGAPEIIAQTGWTTSELAAGIGLAKPMEPYDLVSLLIGVNNQYRGLSEAEYRSEFIVLLRRAIALAGGNAGRVFVISIPDWGATPFAHRQNREEIGLAIDAFNTINRTEAELRGVLYIDITELSRKARYDGSLTADDFLHPTGEMYRLWVEKMQPSVCALLAQEIGD